MKFTVEVVRTGDRGCENVLHRVTVEEISPRRAKTKADQLLGTWRQRGASAARVLNPRGEELYRST